MEFRLLGPLEVIGDDGASIALGGVRPRALLAQLLLHANDVVSTDRLIDGIWGETPPASAAGALQVHVHALRKTLGPDRIVTRPPGYLMRVDGDELDLHRFTRLAATGDPHAALALWRGEALADVAFEPFAQAEAARLEEARLAALEARIDADLDAGRHGDLAGELDAVTAAHPHRERLQAQRMLALYRAGRQADALAAYRDARDALDDLGLEPSAELRTLERRILEQDPSLAPTSRGDTVPLRAATTLVGRRLELAAILALLGRPDVRLLTLTGTGGSGKTRLALAAAAEHDGAVFVDLAPLADARLVLATVAAGLRLGDVSGRELEALEEALAESPPILVLDNLEHLPESFADVARLLEVAPRLRILATSRVPLRLTHEHEYRVPPLGVPQLGVETAAEAESDAVRLYVERARTELPDFALTDANANAVARICRALDGLPLAIELAAARVRVLGPEGTAKRLGERLSLLTRSAPDLHERQRSLRATIDWSYRLLDDEARHVFRLLSVFAGGATLDAVEAVADAGTDVPTALEALLDSGLVTHEAHGGEPRFGMLETIREFAAAELLEAGEEAAARERHLDHFVAFAEAVELQSHNAVTVELLDRVELERDNVRAALAEAARDDDPERQLRLATSLRFFLNVRGPGDESRRMVTDALARRAAASPGQQGRILISAGISATNADDGERALACFDEARELLVAAGDVRAAALADANAATALSRLGRIPESAQRYELALEGFRAVGATAAESQVIANLARYYEHVGDLSKARAYLVEALDIQERGGLAEARAYTVAMLGYLSEREGDLASAAEWTADAISASGELQKDEFLGYGLLFAADLVQRRGDHEQAARLLGASTAAFARSAVVPQDEEAARAMRVRESLSEYGAAEEEGAELDRDRSVELGVTSLAIAQRTRSK